MFGHCGDHIEAGGFGLRRRCGGVRATPFCNVEFRAFGFRIAIIVAPAPDGDSKVNGVFRRGDAHIFAGAAPREGAHIGIREAVGLKGGVFSGLNLFHSEGDFKVDQLPRCDEAFAMLNGFKNLAIIRALAFKNG